MHRFSAVFLIVLQVCRADLFAHDQATVTLLERVLWVQNRTDQQKHCGPTPTTEACTHFVDRRPSFFCVADSNAWRIDASAKVTALIILRRPGTIFDKRAVLEHERLHIGDMRRAVEEYILSLEEQRFTTPAECGDAAAAEARLFDTQLRKFAADSSALRD